MTASAVHVHRQNIPSTSVTLHVSRVCALPTLWLTLSYCLFWRCNCQRLVSGNTSPRPVLQTYLSLVVRKREFVISLDFGTSISTTRTIGDRLTLLYLHFYNIILHKLVHNYQSCDTYKHLRRPQLILQSQARSARHRLVSLSLIEAHSRYSRGSFPMGLCCKGMWLWPSLSKTTVVPLPGLGNCPSRSTAARSSARVASA